MSCFGGLMKEYSRVSLDRFDGKNLQSTVYFLSHLHEDHTVGLNGDLFLKRVQSNKDIFLYCSEVTKVLIEASPKYHKIAPYVKCLEINTPTTVTIPDPFYEEKEQITVTLLPAFHCPGSVMFLIEGNEGTVLYTGDFRWEHFDIEQMHQLRSADSVKRVKSLYVDTTFCCPENLHIPSRQQCIDAVCQIVREWTSQSNQHVVYIQLRAYYGHEPLINSVASRLNRKVHVSKHKHDVYERIHEFSGNFTYDGTSTQLHACDRKCTVEVDGETVLCRDVHDAEKVLCILPTTMYFTQFQQLSLEKIVKRIKSNFYRACYSFHSSYTEVKDLLAYLKPEKVHANVKCPKDNTLDETQHRLNVMLKECMEQGAGEGTPVEMEVKELGTLKTKPGYRTRKRKERESPSDSESLDFGSPLKKTPSEVEIESMTPATTQGRKRGKGRGKRTQDSVSQSAVSTRRSSRLSVASSVNEDQVTPKKRKTSRRSETPDLFLTPEKSKTTEDYNDVQSSYLGSQRSDSELSLLSSQKSHEGSLLSSYKETDWSGGSFLAAVSSNDDDEGMFCVTEDNQELDETAEEAGEDIEVAESQEADTAAGTEQDEPQKDQTYKKDTEREIQDIVDNSSIETTALETVKDLPENLNCETNEEIQSSNASSVVNLEIQSNIDSAVGNQEIKSSNDLAVVHQEILSSNDSAVLNLDIQSNDDSAVLNLEIQSNNDSAVVHEQSSDLHLHLSGSTLCESSEDNIEQHTGTSDNIKTHCEPASVESDGNDGNIKTNDEIVSVESEGNVENIQTNDEIIILDDSDSNEPMAVDDSEELLSNVDNKETIPGILVADDDDGILDIDQSEEELLFKIDNKERYHEILVEDDDDRLLDSDTNEPAHIDGSAEMFSDIDSKEKDNKSLDANDGDNVVDCESNEAVNIDGSEKLLSDIDSKEKDNNILDASNDDHIVVSESNEAVTIEGNEEMLSNINENKVPEVLDVDGEDHVEQKNPGVTTDDASLDTQLDDVASSVKQDTNNDVSENRDGLQAKSHESVNKLPNDSNEDIEQDAVIAIEHHDTNIQETCAVVDHPIPGLDGTVNDSSALNSDGDIGDKPMDVIEEIGIKSLVEEDVDAVDRKSCDEGDGDSKVVGMKSRDEDDTDVTGLKSHEEGDGKVVKSRDEEDDDDVIEIVDLTGEDFCAQYDKQETPKVGFKKAIKISLLSKNTSEKSQKPDKELKKENDDSHAVSGLVEEIGSKTVSDVSENMDGLVETGEVDDGSSSPEWLSVSKATKQKDKIPGIKSSNKNTEIVKKSDFGKKLGTLKRKKVSKKEMELRAELKRQAMGFVCETDSESDSDESSAPDSPTADALYDDYIELSSDSDQEDGAPGSKSGGNKASRKKSDRSGGNRKSDSGNNGSNSSGWLRSQKGRRHAGESDDNVEDGDSDQSLDKEVVTGDQPEDTEVVDQPEDTEVVTGNQPEDTEVVTGNQPEDTEVVTGNQPEDTEVVTGNQPEDTEVVTGDQLEDTEVVNGDQPEEKEVRPDEQSIDVDTSQVPGESKCSRGISESGFKKRENPQRKNYRNNRITDESTFEAPPVEVQSFGPLFYPPQPQSVGKDQSAPDNIQTESSSSLHHPSVPSVSAESSISYPLMVPRTSKGKSKVDVPQPIPRISKAGRSTPLFPISSQTQSQWPASQYQSPVSSQTQPQWPASQFPLPVSSITQPQWPASQFPPQVSSITQQQWPASQFPPPVSSITQPQWSASQFPQTVPSITQPQWTASQFPPPVFSITQPQWPASQLPQSVPPYGSANQEHVAQWPNQNASTNSTVASSSSDKSISKEYRKFMNEVTYGAQKQAIFPVVPQQPQGIQAYGQANMASLKANISALTGISVVAEKPAPASANTATTPGETLDEMVEKLKKIEQMKALLNVVSGKPVEPAVEVNAVGTVGVYDDYTQRSTYQSNEIDDGYQRRREGYPETPRDHIDREYDTRRDHSDRDYAPEARYDREYPRRRGEDADYEQWLEEKRHRDYHRGGSRRPSAHEEVYDDRYPPPPRRSSAHDEPSPYHHREREYDRQPEFRDPDYERPPPPHHRDPEYERPPPRHRDPEYRRPPPGHREWDPEYERPPPPHHRDPEYERPPPRHRRPPPGHEEWDPEYKRPPPPHHAVEEYDRPPPPHRRHPEHKRQPPRHRDPEYRRPPPPHHRDPQYERPPPPHHGDRDPQYERPPPPHHGDLEYERPLPRRRDPEYRQGPPHPHRRPRPEQPLNRQQRPAHEQDYQDTWSQAAYESQDYDANVYKHNEQYTQINEYDAGQNSGNMQGQHAVSGPTTVPHTSGNSAVRPPFNPISRLPIGEFKKRPIMARVLSRSGQVLAVGQANVSMHHIPPELQDESYAEEMEVSEPVFQTGLIPTNR